MAGVGSTVGSAGESGGKKKRKRSNPGESNVIKIQAAQNSRPVLCSFPRGLPAALQEDSNQSNRNSNTIPPPKFLWRQLNQEKSGRTVVGRDEACLYTAQASEAEQESLQSRLCVGVFDKQSDTLTIHLAASSGTVFALQQSVPAYAQSSGSYTPKNMTGNEHRRALFEDFGSSKKRKALRSQEANRVNVDTVVGSGAVMDNLSMSESNLRALKEQKDNGGEGATQLPQSSAANENAKKEFRRKLLPRYQEDAKEPHLVYDAREIAGDLAYGHVSRVVDACLRKDDVATALMHKPTGSRADTNNNSSFHQEWNGSVKAIIYKVAPAQGPSVKHQLKCAHLVNDFTNLYKKLSKKRFIPRPKPDSPRFFGAPTEIGGRFLERFAVEVTDEDDKTGYVMQKVNKDICLLHILILFVMAEGGKAMKATNIKSIADDLEIGVSNAGDLLKEAGFTVQQKSGEATAVLKTPLRFPASMRKRGRA